MRRFWAFSPRAVSHKKLSKAARLYLPANRLRLRCSARLEPHFSRRLMPELPLSGYLAILAGDILIGRRRMIFYSSNLRLPTPAAPFPAWWCACMTSKASAVVQSSELVWSLIHRRFLAPESRKILTSFRRHNISHDI